MLQEDDEFLVWVLSFFRTETLHFMIDYMIFFEGLEKFAGLDLLYV